MSGKDLVIAMEAPTFLWQFGQTLSLFGLGALPTLMADDPYFGRDTDRPSAPFANRGAHAPMNHRLLLEAKS